MDVDREIGTHRRANPPGDDRDLGTGRGWKRGGKRTWEMTADAGTRSGTPGARRDLGSMYRVIRERSVEASGGFWQMAGMGVVQVGVRFALGE